MTEYLTITEVAVLLKVHRNTISRWLNDGAFPNAIDFEGTKRIPLIDIEALKKSSKKEAS
jgi:excisionase family DNA binding protein